MERQPYTHAELQQMLTRVERQIAAAEATYPHARPRPPLTVEECLEHLDRLVDLAGTRALRRDEQFLLGQFHHALRRPRWPASSLKKDCEMHQDRPLQDPRTQE